MKKILLLSTLLLLLAAITSCHKNSDEPTPTPSPEDYSVEYKLSIFTNQAGEKGRSQIIEMAKNNLKPLGLELKQMSESVWGITINYDNDSIQALKCYEELSGTAIIPENISTQDGILFYGSIDELKQLSTPSNESTTHYNYYMMIPEPDKYRYVINRNTWDIKWFEYNKEFTPSIEANHAGCYAQVTTNSGEHRNAHFTAEGVDVYKAGSNTTIEASIRYHFNPNKELQATLTILEGSSVNMPITLEVR